MNFDNLIGDKPDIHDVLAELEDKKIPYDRTFFYNIVNTLYPHSVEDAIEKLEIQR